MPDKKNKNENGAVDSGSAARTQGRRPAQRRTRRPSAPRAAAKPPEDANRSKPLPEQDKPDLVEALLRQNGAAEKTGEKKAEAQPKAAEGSKAAATSKEQPKKNTRAKSGRSKNTKQVEQQPAKAAKQAEQPAKAAKKTEQPTKAKPKKANSQPKGGNQAKGSGQTKAAPALVENKAVAPRNPQARSKRGGGKAKKKALRIIPLGGLGEVGKNITVYEYDGDAFIVDCGLTFPDEAMPGVDLVIPDFTYVLEIKDRIKGIVITHGHEDHIGSLAYLLKHVNIPIYATKLTVGLIEGKLKEHGLLNKAKLNVRKPGDKVKMGCMEVEFINVNHSIPDAVAFAIHTPVGVVIQTGDFKIDFTPINGQIIDLARFGELGGQGVLALLSDSTNAERPGATASERTVGVSFDKLFTASIGKRILVATFASNVHRVQQIIDAAVRYGRKVAVSGRSMENVVNKALELGYLNIPSGVLVEMDAVGKYPNDKMVIITTGSQGEPMSALTRMAMGDHRKVTVTANDSIIISASPIPGNEKLVGRVINELLKLGAEVFYEKTYDIHVSGHACQDELKMMMAMTKPKFFMPMHGEYKHLKKHADLARSMGIPDERILLTDIGKVVELDGETIKVTGTVTAGKILVDGLGVGDVGSIVLRDRKHLAQDGLIVVVIAIDVKTGKILSGPDIVSRGFVYVRESEDMIGKARDIARNCIKKCVDKNTREWGTLKQKVKDEVGDYLWQVTKRNPMILPVIQEI